MAVKFMDHDKNIIIEEEEDADEISKEDENSFSNLCNNVINCVVLMQNAQSELQEFKSLLLKEHIAPSVLVKLSLINGKMFRSMSDLHNPLGELIRLVRVYSENWEKKRESLRKLHTLYEKKAGQLNVALKQLAIQNEDKNRISKKETLQNWEYLFTRAQLERNHGKRWKYRMFEFKLKAENGIDSLQDYFQQLLDEDDGIKEKVKFIPREPQKLDSRTKSQINESSKSNYDDLLVKDLEDGKMSDEEEYQESVEEKAETESAEPIDTVDVSVGTSDLNFSQTLVMRIYNAKGLETFENLKARIIYGNKLYQTGDLDKSKELELEEARLESEKAESLSINTSEPPKSKGGLIGRKRNKQAKVPEKSVEIIRKEQYEKRLRYLSKNEEVRILIPSDVISGVNKNSIYQSIKIILFINGKVENKIAQAVIDLEEIKDLDLQIFKEFVYQGDMVTPPSTANLDDKPFPNLEPMTFPLYQYQETGTSENSPIQMGQLPIGCFFSRKEEQMLFHRLTETQPINRLVEELTGVNLDIISLEELLREKVDESLSPRPETPRPATILKSEFDAIRNQYEEQISSIHDQYENKIKEILETRASSPVKEIPRPSSVYHKDCAVSPIFPYRSVPGNSRFEKRESRQIDNVNENRHSSKSRDTLSTSGPDDQELIYSSYDATDKDDVLKDGFKSTSNLKLNLPENFLERVSFFSEKSNKHKEELAHRVKTEIAKAVEERLAELYRIHSDLTEEDVSLALADMCLPAMFMPMTNSTGTVYNPRAHQYFHPLGLKSLRISQAPSIFKLPPIKNNQFSILNLFEIGNQMQIKRFDKDMSNTNSIKQIINPSTNLVKPESTNLLSSDN